MRHTAVGIVLLDARRYTEAIDQLRETLEMDPDFVTARFHLFNAYMVTGQHEAAVEQKRLESLGRGASPDRAEQHSRVFARSGIEGYLKWRLERLDEWASNSYVPPYFYASTHAWLGDVDSAIQSLETMYDARDAELAGLREDPIWDALRSDPRFQDLVRRMNFPPG